MKNDFYSTDQRVFTFEGDFYFWGYGTDADEAFDDFKRYLINAEQNDASPLLQIDPSNINSGTDSNPLPFNEAISYLATKDPLGGSIYSCGILDKKYFTKNVNIVTLDSNELNVYVKGDVFVSPKVLSLIKENDTITSISVKSYRTKSKIDYGKNASKKIRHFVLAINEETIFKSQKIGELKKFTKQYLTTNRIDNFDIREEFLAEDGKPLHNFKRITTKQIIKLKLTTGILKDDKKIKTNVYLFRYPKN